MGDQSHPGEGGDVDTRDICTGCLLFTSPPAIGTDKVVALMLGAGAAVNDADVDQEFPLPELGGGWYLSWTIS